MSNHYFRRLTANQPSVTIQHNLGCFPVVDVYELLPINIPNITPPPKFYLYYGHDERQALLKAIGGHGQVALGTLIEPLLIEYQIKYETDDSFGDVINDFLDAFFVLPNADEMEHLASSWIDKHRESIVANLQSHGEWNDIRWFTWPNKLVVGQPVTIKTNSLIPLSNLPTPLPTPQPLPSSPIPLPTPQPLPDSPTPLPTPQPFPIPVISTFTLVPPVNIVHLGYDTLEVVAAPNLTADLDVMLVLQV